MSDTTTEPAEFSFETYEPGPCVVAAIECAAFQITNAGLKNHRAAEALAPLMVTMVAAVAMAELAELGVAPFSDELDKSGKLNDEEKAGADALSEWAGARVAGASLVALFDRMKSANSPLVTLIIGRLSE